MAVPQISAVTPSPFAGSLLFMNRRTFIHSGAGVLLEAVRLNAAKEEPAPALELPAAHLAEVRRRQKRIVVQYDATDPLWRYWKLNRDPDASFEVFQKAVFSHMDEPGTQIDAVWWDIGGSPLSSAYPSKLGPPVSHPLLQQWLSKGVDWVEKLVHETRRRGLEVFWNHRISEVECLPEGGLSKLPHPLKVEHPDWALPAAWWPQGMWNLAAAGLREHKVGLLRELVQNYDLDGIQIDFSRHMPCLPVGRQWEMRGHASEFMRLVRVMLLDVAQRRGRPLLLAAKVPQTIAGCRSDGLDLEDWARRRLVDILTLGSRSMDVDVEGIREAVGPAIRLQPCVDDHHATDGYRHGSIEFLRGVFANHLQRGADSVVTFNWSIGTPEICNTLGSEIGPPSHGLAYKEAGDKETLEGKNKFFAVERRGGYPWSEGFFNRNDTAPLPLRLTETTNAATFTLHISDAPQAAQGGNQLTLRCIVFQAGDNDALEIRWNGSLLPLSARDAEWKDPQIFSPNPQPTSGYKPRPINPQQRLLRLDYAVSNEVWRQGGNRVEVRSCSVDGGSPGPAVQIEKLEAHLFYDQRLY